MNKIILTFYIFNALRASMGARQDHLTEKKVKAQYKIFKKDYGKEIKKLFPKQKKEAKQLIMKTLKEFKLLSYAKYVGDSMFNVNQEYPNSEVRQYTHDFIILHDKLIEMTMTFYDHFLKSKKKTKKQQEQLQKMNIYQNIIYPLQEDKQIYVYNNKKWKDFIRLKFVHYSRMMSYIKACQKINQRFGSFCRHHQRIILPKLYTKDHIPTGQFLNYILYIVKQKKKFQNKNTLSDKKLRIAKRKDREAISSIQDLLTIDMDDLDLDDNSMLKMLIKNPVHKKKIQKKFKKNKKILKYIDTRQSISDSDTDNDNDSSSKLKKSVYDIPYQKLEMDIKKSNKFKNKKQNLKNIQKIAIMQEDDDKNEIDELQLSHIYENKFDVSQLSDSNSNPKFIKNQKIQIQSEEYSDDDFKKKLNKNLRYKKQKNYDLNKNDMSSDDDIKKRLRKKKNYQLNNDISSDDDNKKRLMKKKNYLLKNNISSEDDNKKKYNPKKKKNLNDEVDDFIKEIENQEKLFKLKPSTNIRQISPSINKKSKFKPIDSKSQSINKTKFNLKDYKFSPKVDQNRFKNMLKTPMKLLNKKGKPEYFVRNNKFNKDLINKKLHPIKPEQLDLQTKISNFKRKKAFQFKHPKEFLKNYEKNSDSKKFKRDSLSKLKFNINSPKPKSGFKLNTPSKIHNISPRINKFQKQQDDFDKKIEDLKKHINPLINKQKKEIEDFDKLYKKPSNFQKLLNKPYNKDSLDKFRNKKTDQDSFDPLGKFKLERQNKLKKQLKLLDDIKLEPLNKAFNNDKKLLYKSGLDKDSKEDDSFDQKLNSFIKKSEKENDTIFDRFKKSNGKITKPNSFDIEQPKLNKLSIDNDDRIKRNIINDEFNYDNNNTKKEDPQLLEESSNYFNNIKFQPIQDKKLNSKIYKTKPSSNDFEYKLKQSDKNIQTSFHNQPKNIEIQTSFEKPKDNQMQTSELKQKDNIMQTSQLSNREQGNQANFPGPLDISLTQSNNYSKLNKSLLESPKLIQRFKKLDDSKIDDWVNSNNFKKKSKIQFTKGNSEELEKDSLENQNPDLSSISKWDVSRIKNKQFSPQISLDLSEGDLSKEKLQLSNKNLQTSSIVKDDKDNRMNIKPKVNQMLNSYIYDLKDSKIGNSSRFDNNKSNLSSKNQSQSAIDNISKLHDLTDSNIYDKSDWSDFDYTRSYLSKQESDPTVSSIDDLSSIPTDRDNKKSQIKENNSIVSNDSNLQSSSFPTINLSPLQKEDQKEIKEIKEIQRLETDESMLEKSQIQPMGYSFEKVILENDNVNDFSNFSSEKTLADSELKHIDLSSFGTDSKILSNNNSLISNNNSQIPFTQTSALNLNPSNPNIKSSIQDTKNKSPRKSTIQNSIPKTQKPIRIIYLIEIKTSKYCLEDNYFHNLIMKFTKIN